jgi:hypothetical protein
MRRELALVGLLACHNDSEPPLLAPAPALAPAPVAQPAKPQLVELLHAGGATVVVSSRVANRAIRPEHLVDRDLNTLPDVRYLGGHVDCLRRPST